MVGRLKHKQSDHWDGVPAPPGGGQPKYKLRIPVNWYCTAGTQTQSQFPTLCGATSSKLKLPEIMYSDMRDAIPQIQRVADAVLKSISILILLKQGPPPDPTFGFFFFVCIIYLF